MAGTVTVLDTITHQMITKIHFKIPGVTMEKIQPVGIQIDRERQRAYVALGPSNRVAVIDAKTYQVLDYLLVGQRVWQLAFTPNQRFLSTTNGLSNDISIIDLQQRKVTKSVAVGQYPWGIAIAP